MKRFNLFTIVAIVAAVAFTASAAFGAASKPKLSFTKSNATVGWSTDGGSSPGGGVSNANNQSIKLNAAAGGGGSAYTYGPDEALVGLRGITPAQISHLGFDSKGYLGAGAPRISMETLGTSGTHQYFFSAFYCNTPTSGGWRTSNFLNPTDDPACTIFRDGVQMTWSAAVALATADNEVVNSTPGDWFLVVDEAPSLTYVDRLSVQNWCWTGNGTNGIISSNSGDCI